MNRLGFVCVVRIAYVMCVFWNVFRERTYFAISQMINACVINEWSPVNVMGPVAQSV